MKRSFLVLVVLLGACGAGTTQRARPATDGAIAGLVRDRASGEVIAMAELRLVAQNGHETLIKSEANGLYSVDHVAPGRYTLFARFADQPITITNIDIRVGEATFVDVTFTLGNPEPLTVDYGDPRDGEIETFASTRGTLIEGIVAESGSRARIAGVVVTAERGGPEHTLQTISDDHGRYRFEALAPGTYIVSAYYSIGGRGQIEVRRSDIRVDSDQRVVVPLWVEVTKQ